MTKRTFLYNNLYSSSLFYGLVVFHMHTGEKGDLDLRQLSRITNITTKKKGSGSRMAASCGLDDTFKFNCATYDTLDAVKTFLRSETEPFLFSFFFPDCTSIIISYLELFVAYHMPFFKRGDSLSVFFFLLFFDKGKKSFQG